MPTLHPQRPDVNRPSRQVCRARERALGKEYQLRQRQENRVFAEELAQAARRAVQRLVDEDMAAQVEEMLGRADGQRRDRSDQTQVEECCNKCGTHLRRRFSRKGFYPRSLGSLEGLLTLRVPRVRCLCGGDVSIVFRRFSPYERQLVDVEDELLVLSALCLSTREIEVVFADRGLHIGRTVISERIVSVAALSEAAFNEGMQVPPVVQLDGIFLKEAEETAERFVDKKGKQRKRKKVRKKALLVAWGIYPDTGKRVLLCWEEGNEEDTEACLALLRKLAARGIEAKNGLRLFVHDGGSGFEQAFEQISFGQVEHQRCIFHKMRNVVKEVRGEEGMTRQQKRERRREVLDDLVKVWSGKSAAEVRGNAEEFAAKWQAKEPDAVKKLRYQFDATLAYFVVQEQARQEGKEWDARFLRTTSSLERVNRSIRKKARAANVFQTSKGLRGGVYMAIGCQEKTKPGQLRGWVQKLRDSGGHAGRPPEIPCP